MRTLIHQKNKIYHPCKIIEAIKISSFRNEIASMEHPFFVLKGGDTQRRKYKNGNVVITLTPNLSGLATIFDKDIWIYAISKLKELINRNKSIGKTIAFTPYNFFVTTNRDKGGRSYKELKKTLSRLKGTTIKTNIIDFKSIEKKETIEFGLIDSWRILEVKKGKKEKDMIEITLPNWLYQAINKTQILKINPNYFRIRKAIDRRIYEICRKHCGNQYEFTITLKKLHLKTGSLRELRKFKFEIKKLSKINDLPDYEMIFHEKENKITFINRNKNINQIEMSKKQKIARQAIFKIKNKLKIFKRNTSEHFRY